MDPCTGYECFITQILMAGETVGVFFAALKKLAVLFRGLSEWILWLDSQLGWSNYWGPLLASRQRQLISYLTTHKLLSRMKQNWGSSCNGCANPQRLDTRARVNYFCCGRIGYITKDCTVKRREHIHCFQCGRIRHIASNCPGNELGDKMLAVE